MGVRSFLASCSRLLKTAKKPGKSEVWLSVKICALGIIVIGLIGFVIQYVASLLLGPS